MHVFTLVSLLTAGFIALFVACVTDIRERNIPNEVVVYVLLAGLGLRLTFSPDLLWLSVAGAAFLVIVLGQFTRFDIIGGGDAKLMAASMLLLPPERDAQLMLNIAIAGGMLSCIYLGARTVLRKRFALQTAAPSQGVTKAETTLVSHELANICAGEPVPYALAIAAGVIYSILIEAVSCVYGTSCSL
jgi:prepilin peptidase CpaA